MKVSLVRFDLVDGGKSILARGDIVIGEETVMLRGVCLFKGKEANSFFVAPSRQKGKNENWYDVGWSFRMVEKGKLSPNSQELQKALLDVMLTEYRKGAGGASVTPPTPASSNGGI
jgi:hypothetical protein